MTSTLVLGSTGMTGCHILSTLFSLPASQISSIATISRRAPPATPPSSSTPKDTPSLNAVTSSDTSTWISSIKSLTPLPEILFSALATTKGAAGSFEAQYKLEHDLNIELAKAAREHGTNIYVLISAASSSLSSPFPYVKMKAEIERDVLALDFAHTVIVRPGLISGRREESRPAEAVIRRIADVFGAVSGGRLKDFWAQDADVIARASVRAALKAKAGEYDGNGKVTYLHAKEIMELGRERM